MSQGALAPTPPRPTRHFTLKGEAWFYAERAKQHKRFVRAAQPQSSQLLVSFELGFGPQGSAHPVHADESGSGFCGRVKGGLLEAKRLMPATSDCHHGHLDPTPRATPLAFLSVAWALVLIGALVLLVAYPNLPNQVPLYRSPWGTAEGAKSWLTVGRIAFMGAGQLVC
jgi:hypothetical protein